jgi:pimeloyl-ACP methyl ester carboxylesterase
MTRRNWIEISGKVRQEAQKGVYSASYDLHDVMQSKGISKKELNEFQKKTGLETIYWRTYWRRGDLIKMGGRDRMPRRADCMVVFMHGWDGCGEIFENLPARVCESEAKVLVLVPDVNGFYRSRFLEPKNLRYAQCNPQANMRAVEEWLHIIGVLGGRRHMPIVFVGHSMSGAALFYLNKKKWKNHRFGRLALAPALLMNDSLRKGFYNALGLGIWAGNALSLNRVSDSVSPLVVNQLIAGASKAVQNAHETVFKRTAKSTLANTFAAMGQANAPAQPSKWADFKVLLGHTDRLVGLTSMLDLLVQLGFTSRQVSVLLGDHYFFSVGHHSRSLHRESREVTFEKICKMVRTCR